jgi:hypothetical protein
MCLELIFNIFNDFNILILKIKKYFNIFLNKKHFKKSASFIHCIEYMLKSESPFIIAFTQKISNYTLLNPSTSGKPFL